MKGHCTECKEDGEMFDIPQELGTPTPYVYCGVCFTVYDRDSMNPIGTFGTGATYYRGPCEKYAFAGSREELD
jgi:hypothetical protein